MVSWATGPGEITSSQRQWPVPGMPSPLAKTSAAASKVEAEHSAGAAMTRARSGTARPWTVPHLLRYQVVSVSLRLTQVIATFVELSQPGLPIAGDRTMMGSWATVRPATDNLPSQSREAELSCA